VSRRTPLIVAFVVTAIGLIVAGALTRPDEDHVALAIQRAERPDGIIVFHVECADDVRVEVRPDPAASGLSQVTVWGSPKTGTCDTKARLSARDMYGTQFVDGATSQVVTIIT
jgi:hypothetical protein